MTTGVSASVARMRSGWVSFVETHAAPHTPAVPTALSTIDSEADGEREADEHDGENSEVDPEGERAVLDHQVLEAVLQGRGFGGWCGVLGRRGRHAERSVAPGVTSGSPPGRKSVPRRRRHSGRAVLISDAMRSFPLVAFTLASVVACASAEQPPPVVPPAPPPTASPAPPAPVAVAAAPAPEPTPEEKKKAEEAQKLEQDWAKLREKHTAELARLTPEIRAAAKALAEKAYPTTRAAISATLKGTHRAPGNAERDASRHPLETLEFFGMKPTHAVLEYGPGEGWYTELVAPALASKGKLSVTMTDPNGPKTERSTLYGERTKLFIERLPEAYGKIETVLVDAKAPKLGADATHGRRDAHPRRARHAQQQDCSARGSRSFIVCSSRTGASASSSIARHRTKTPT